MIGRFGWMLNGFARQVWVRATVFSIAAVIIALLAAFIGPYIPYDPGLTLASGSVDSILNILATSMLAVTTFSLSIMVSAYAAATANATPRSTKLLLSDRTAQNTLSTFVGSFLFSIVGIVGLTAGLYSSRGRVLLFFATLVVLLIVVTALLRWIEHLGKFGRVGDTILRVEQATRSPLETVACRPFSDALPPIAIPAGSIAVRSDCSGYVQHIDFNALDEIADDVGLTVHIVVLIGAMVHPERILMQVDCGAGAGAPAGAGADDDWAKRLRGCFSIGTQREFDHDPRFGMIVLSEIASRALSPAVNDPGTAIEVAGAGLRLFLAYGAGRSQAATPPCFRRVHTPDVDVDELMFSFFNPIARDGAAILEVQQRLVSVLAIMADTYPALFGAGARQHAHYIVERSRDAMASVIDHDRLAGTAQALLSPD